MTKEDLDLIDSIIDKKLESKLKPVFEELLGALHDLRNRVREAHVKAEENSRAINVLIKKK